MFRALLYRELQLGLAGFTLRFSLLILTVLTPLSAYTQAGYYSQEIADYQIRQRIHQAENTASYVLVTRAVPPLLPVFNGVYSQLPSEVALRSGASYMQPSSEDLKPLDQLFPRPDLSLIVGVLMTLMAILLGHDSITGERERGTLKLLLASPVSRRVILAAKFAAVASLMVACLAYTLALYITLLAIFNGGPFRLATPNVAEVATIFLFACLMLLVFSTLGIAVSTMVKRSETALAISVGISVFTLFIWPSVSPYLASRFWPVTQSRQTAQQRLLDKEGELIEAELASHRQSAADLKERRVDVEEAWRHYNELNLYWVGRKREEIAGLIEIRQREVRQQQMAARNISLASPYGAFKEALASLCGTGLKDYDEFLAAAERYYTEEFTPASLRSYSQERPWSPRSAESGSFNIRPFQMTASSLKERLGDTYLAMGLLIGEIVLLLAVAFLRFDYYDVR
jgi:ABC-type transport system involved in multi-copper enzyme maturation permease subunit